MAQSEYQKMFEAETSYFWFVAKHGLAARLAARLGLGRDSQVLDLGCGTGINLKHLQNAGFAIGLDYFPEAFQYCLARSLTDLVLSKGEVLPFKANSFDLITSLDTLERDF
jgi:ubiquinone/menaquinone biosynthesis C-methylase UbiE